MIFIHTSQAVMYAVRFTGDSLPIQSLSIFVLVLLLIPVYVKVDTRRAVAADAGICCRPAS